MFFTKSATARILGVAVTAVREVRVWAKVVWVNVKGVGCRFISKKTYLAEFARYRREGAASLEVAPAFGSERADLEAAWVIKGGAEPHRVELSNSQFSCDCWDYQNQAEVMGKGCCKHIYAALGTLGYSSLSEFVKPELQAA